MKQTWITREEYEKDQRTLNRRLESRGPMSPPSFRAYRSGSQSITVATSEELVHLNDKVWDNYRAFDEVTNHRWTCPVAGRYQINCAIRLKNESGVAANLYMRLRMGGAAGTVVLHPLQEMSVADTLVALRHGSAQYVFAVNDYVEMYVYTTQQPVTVADGLQYTFMDMFFIGT